MGKIVIMPNQPNKVLEIHEILDSLTAMRKKQDKIDFLRKHDSMALRDVLKGTFDPAIQWNLPEGAPPYEQENEDVSPSTLRKKHRDFKYFVKGLQISERLNPIRREVLFIRLLESIHPEDAKIVISMKDKKQPVKGLTKKLVEEAFPGLISVAS